MVDASVKDRAFLTLVTWASEDDQAAAECESEVTDLLSATLFLP